MALQESRGSGSQGGKGGVARADGTVAWHRQKIMRAVREKDKHTLFWCRSERRGARANQPLLLVLGWGGGG